jgi:hypothetical protein
MRWRLSRRFDQEARKIADRHYSRQKPGTPDFVGNVKPLVLLAPIAGPALALWVTAWQAYVCHEWTDAWQCVLFRNEGAGLSSELIAEAVAATRWCWGGMPANGFVTFVDRSKTRPKRDPGYCYRMAGWRDVGRTKGGLVVLRLSPNDMPDPSPPHGGQPSLFDTSRTWSNARSENVRVRGLEAGGEGHALAGGGRGGRRGWWEDYACGCVSETVARKKDLVGYCPVHGEDRRRAWPEEPPPPPATGTQPLPRYLTSAQTEETRNGR